MTNKTKSFILATYLVLNTISISGCQSKKSTDYYAYCYQNNAGLTAYYPEDTNDTYIYIPSDTDNLIKTDEYVVLNDESKELYEYLLENKLFIIKDNELYLSNFMKEHQEFTEYEYTYEENKTSWTANIEKLSQYENITLTGNTRTCKFLYQGIKLEKDSEGNRHEITSPFVENILDIKEEYPYFKIYCYKTVDLNNQEVSYNDKTEEEIIMEYCTYNKEEHNQGKILIKNKK